MTITTSYNSKALQQPCEDKIIEYHKEFQMSPESIKNDIPALRDWLIQNPHLPNIDDDGRLERILFYCKNSLEKSKRFIEKHYTLRSQYPEFFAHRDPTLSKLVDVEKIATYVPLPKLTKTGQRVVLFKLYTPENIGNFDPEAFCTRTFMTYDFRVSHDTARTDILVYDLSNVSMAVMGVMPLQMIKKLMSIGSNAFPFRISSFVVYNSNKVLENIINIAKTFIPKKLTNRVQAIHGLDKLHELVPKEILPRDYEGDEAMTLEEMRDQWDEELIRNRGWFIREQDLKTDEHKRSGKPFEQKETFEGSFRKITLD
ncbi:hypothetical protein M8J76_017323 [Diaphorina citri]|nr:hypothetical protein M8J76_017323 [Diaphorina citri]